MSQVSPAIGVLALVFVITALFFLGRWLNGLSRHFATVFEWEHALCYRDGRFEGLMPPGRSFTWKPSRRSIVRLPRRDRIETSPPIDVTSADKLVYRLSATLGYRIVDPREAHESDYLPMLQHAVAMALPRIASARSLEALISERVALDAELLSAIGPRVAGCEIVSATIASITLPPEVRRLFSEVERARLEGVAALERARGEQASLRALANAARVLEGNPRLMNLRVLQAVSGKGQATLVLGSNAILPTDAEGGGRPASA